MRCNAIPMLTFFPFLLLLLHSERQSNISQYSTHSIHNPYPAYSSSIGDSGASYPSGSSVYAEPPIEQRGSGDKGGRCFQVLVVGLLSLILFVCAAGFYQLNATNQGGTLVFARTLHRKQEVVLCVREYVCCFLLLPARLLLSFRMLQGSECCNFRSYCFLLHHSAFL